MGWLARKYGLQTNSVTAIELVTADGRPVRVDPEHEPDLFWALRGGSGNFGVVTAIEFDVYAVEDLYAGVMFFRFERAGEVLHAWSELVPTLPDELMSRASLLQFPDAPFVPEPVRGGWADEARRVASRSGRSTAAPVSIATRSERPSPRQRCRATAPGPGGHRSSIA